MGTVAGNPSANITKYQRVAQCIEQDINRGALSAGDRLPSIRQLVTDFGVAKNTVICALRLLEARGLIEAKPKSGFIVKPRVVVTPPLTPVFDSIRPSRIAIPELLREVIARGAAFDIKPSEPVEQTSGQLTQLHRFINKAMRTQSARKTLYYDDPQGSAELREQLCQHYAKSGLKLDRADLCITGGCQHALLLALMATCKPGDNVVIESPGFYGVIQLLDELGLHAIEVPCKSLSGLDVDTLERVLQQYAVKACVVTPAFSTPTGACMPDSAKQRLLALAEQHDFALIEDDIYGDLGFHFRPRPLKAFDTSARVILCSSFSKSLSRDLRIGWIVGGRWQRKIQRLKLVTQLASNQSTQAGLAEFLATGSYARYLNTVVKTLQVQRDRLSDVIVATWGTEVRFTHPSGGLAMWLELPHQRDTLPLYQQALKHQIVLTPGALFTAHNDFSRFLRLSFCHPMTPGRVAAIKKIMVLSDAR